MTGSRSNNGPSPGSAIKTHLNDRKLSNEHEAAAIEELTHHNRSSILSGESPSGRQVLTERDSRLVSNAPVGNTSIGCSVTRRRKSSFNLRLGSDEIIPDVSTCSPECSSSAEGQTGGATAKSTAVPSKPMMKRKLLLSDELPLGINPLYNANRKKQQQFERQKKLREKIISSLKTNSIS